MEKITKKYYASNQEVKWCPGCGDYAILSSFQMAMAKLQVPREKLAVVAGIGCSSRFPYYMASYGMHTIHGRAPAFATGLKLQNPELDVWVITGDGDGLSIGGNHLAHVLRRNVNVNIILFNNEIYGLTKGQFSPTSQVNLKTKSSPFGSVDQPFNPAQFIMGAGASFYARTIDTDPKHMQEMFLAAQAHQGTSIIEIFQNCVIFNDKVHDEYTNRQTRDNTTFRLEEGKKYLFAKGEKAVDLNNNTWQEVEPDEATTHHDPSNKLRSFMLTQLPQNGLPLPLGVFYKESRPVYETVIYDQIENVQQKKAKRSVKEILESGNTWEV